MKIEELDIATWVAGAEPNKKTFREAVHIILAAISSSSTLSSTMIMKGGMLMAIRYNSSRFTKDTDFSTKEKYTKDNEQALIKELSQQLDYVNETLSYDTMCRCQRYEIRPSRENAVFPTLTLSIGYAQRSKPRELTRLLAGQAPTIVEIDYSYNEAVLDVEVLSISDGVELKAYSFLNLIAEKLRSLLQQPIRKRNRRQDIYDLNWLILDSQPLVENEKTQLLQLIIESCSQRNISAERTSFANSEVKEMAEQDYENLESEIDGPLPNFNDAYSRVQNFYESLPWPK